MARAREKPTTPAKKRNAPRDEKAPLATTQKARAARPSPAKKRNAARDEKTPPSPRSTQRSAFEEPARRRRRPARRASVQPAERSGKANLLPHAPVPHAAPSITTPNEVHPSGGPQDASRVMDFHWGDDAPSSRRTESLVQRWVKRGDALLRRLAEHGAAKDEYRADLAEGRFVWIGRDGRVSAEAQARVICSWSRWTTALTMAWADPLVKSASVARMQGMPAERDDIDEEGAWRVAIECAESLSADYLYRVIAPHAWYFVALSNLTFHPERASFSPSAPVGLVLKSLEETRRAVESRAEPTDVVRDRLLGVGNALVHEAGYAYRGTDWVARLDRTGRRLVTLAEQLPRASFNSLAAGRYGPEWLSRDATIELSNAIALLEDEWALFA
jgi:hypothetical protein